VTENERDRYHLLRKITWAALTAGEHGKARRFAEELVARVGEPDLADLVGDATHEGNIALGRLALLDGDVERAKRHLIEAGKTPGSAPLRSFGPAWDWPRISWALAQGRPCWSTFGSAQCSGRPRTRSWTSGFTQSSRVASPTSGATYVTDEAGDRTWYSGHKGTGRHRQMEPLPNGRADPTLEAGPVTIFRM
jgi:hypothetical protein